MARADATRDGDASDAKRRALRDACTSNAMRAMDENAHESALRWISLALARHEMDDGGAMRAAGGGDRLHLTIVDGAVEVENHGPAPIPPPEPIPPELDDVRDLVGMNLLDDSDDIDGLDVTNDTLVDVLPVLD